MSVDYVSYLGMEVRTFDEEMVYFDDWLSSMGYKSKEQIECEADDPDAEWEAIEEEFEEWCDEHGVIGETC